MGSPLAPNLKKLPFTPINNNVNDSQFIFEAYKNNTLKDADGVEIVNPHVRKFDNNFHLDEYLQRILYSYRKYQNPGGNLDKGKFIQAVDSIWTGTHPRALQNLHQELLKIRPGNYKPQEKDFHSYLKNWLKEEALNKVWSDLSKEENAEQKKDSFDMHVDQLKNTPTEELIEDLEDLYRIVADEKNVGDYSYDSAKLDIEIIHDILKSRGLDFQKDLAPIWNKVDDEVNGSEESAEDKKGPFHYDPMVGLEKAAREIRDILLSSANDEARTEHIEKMAHIILGSPKDHDPRLYNKMLEGLIILLNRFVVSEMN